MATAELIIHIIISGLLIGILGIGPHGSDWGVVHTTHPQQGPHVGTGHGFGGFTVRSVLCAAHRIRHIDSHRLYRKQPSALADSRQLCPLLLRHLSIPAESCPKHPQTAKPEKFFYTRLCLGIPAHTLQPADTLPADRTLCPSQLFRARDADWPLHSRICVDYTRRVHLVVYHHLYHRQSAHAVNLRSLWLINRSIGIIIIVMSLVGVGTGFYEYFIK